MGPTRSMTALETQLIDRESQFARDRAIMVTRHLQARVPSTASEQTSARRVPLAIDLHREF